MTQSFILELVLEIGHLAIFETTSSPTLHSGPQFLETEVMSNCERIGGKKSAAQGGRSYAEARESVAKSYELDNLEHPSRGYYYRRAGSLVKGSGFPVFRKMEMRRRCLSCGT